MPIIVLWNETVAGSERRILQWLRSMEDSNRSQYWWLRRRVDATEKAELATRAFPVFRFSNDSITARVSRTQFGALLDAPVTSFGQHVVQAADEWNFVREWNESAASAMLLPELIRTLGEIVAGVHGSVGRFLHPNRGMFDLDRLDASDLAGLAALTFRTLGHDRRALMDRARAVHGAISPTGPGPEEADAAAAPSPPLLVGLDNMSRALDEYTREVVAGLLLIPALGNLVPRMAADIRLAFSHWFIDLAEGIETGVYDLRRDVLSVFAVDLPDALAAAFGILDAIRTFALDNIRFGTLVGIEVLQGAFGGLTTFGGQLRGMWDGLVVLINALTQTGQAIVDLDIGAPIHHALEAIDSAINNLNPLLRADPYDAPAEFPVTVGEFVLGQGAGARAQRELQAGVAGLRRAWSNLAAEDLHEWLIEGVTGYSPPKMIGAIGALVDALGHPQHVPGAVPTLVFDGSDMDDIGARIVEPLRRGAEGILTRLENDASMAIQGVGNSAHGALTTTAAAFDSAAARATRAGSLRLIEGIAGDTDHFMRAVLGDQQPSADDDRFDALAGQYAAWLVQGGFDVIGAAMAGYVGTMLDVWEADLAANADTPFDVTEASPRKLLERARLGRVHATRLRIGVRADELGRPLAARIADTFQTSVTDAYRAGQDRLGRRLDEASAVAL